MFDDTDVGSTGASAGAGADAPAGHRVSAAQWVDRIAAAEQRTRVSVAAQLLDIVGFDDAQRRADQANRVPTHLVGRTVGVQVALTLGISASAGAGRVAFARTVLHEHPALWHLLRQGLTSEWHLRLVTTATTGLDTTHKQQVAAWLAADITARHTRKASELSPHQLAQAAARLVIQIDPQAATRRYEQARRQRQVSVTDRHDGTAALWAVGSAEQTQHLHDLLARDARTRRHDGDPRNLDDIMYTQLYESVVTAMKRPRLSAAFIRVPALG